ncbi:hypothetical protein DRO54_03420 [Candidatus Bathyarchaeota archaeon]|nr:MAG: hypothetical protein DRO54_03420 [Candidatus Bathyarchaeota archaeon]
MPEIIIDVSELKSKANGETIRELEDFLREKLGIEISFAGDEARIDSENIKKSYLKVILKKFLHKVDLKENFRVLSKGNNIFMFKERKVWVPPEE